MRVCPRWAEGALEASVETPNTIDQTLISPLRKGKRIPTFGSQDETKFSTLHAEGFGSVRKSPLGQSVLMSRPWSPGEKAPKPD